jgi:hypothetical protein
MNKGERVRIYERMQKDHRRQNRLMAFLGILLIAIIFGILLILGNQAQILIQQTDTLNKLNEISVVVDPEAPDPAPAEPTVTYQLTPEERDLVERVTAAESRGEDLQGQMAVAQTILDRAELWNMTPTEVVQAPGQYAGPYPGEISDSIHLAVANVFDGGIRVFQEPITHFYSGAEPSWTDGKVNRGSVGSHRFYY